MENESVINKRITQFSKGADIAQTIIIFLIALLVPTFLGQLITKVFGATSVIASNSQLIIGTIVNMALVTTAINLKGWAKILGVVTMPSISTILSGYVFGTASIAAGNYDIMAAVMIGGMVPPCAIALATLLFKNKFTKQERESGPVNFIMGLAFITEGAIPYAASDPLHVLPSCIIGSAVSGALSMAFGCTLMAPHGGIFVFPVVENPLMYLISLVAGTVIGALLLGVLKKKAEA